MNFSQHDPFSGHAPESIPLPETPLTGVLVQVMFPEILSISTKSDFVAAFQEDIRQGYPLIRKETNLVFQVGENAATQTSVPIWRFLDSDSKWRVSLTTNFVAIETRDYESRADLVQRVTEILQALKDSVNPSIVTRVGVRYIDQVHGKQLEKLDQLVRPEILGLFHSNRSENLERTLSEISASTDEGHLNARWGYLLPNQTHEPDLMPAIKMQSWFLDTDVYKQYNSSVSFEVLEIRGSVTRMADRAYSFFRWATNDEFLREYGGEI